MTNETMEQVVLEQAGEIAAAGAGEQALLALFCRQQLRCWTARLRPEVSPEDCRESLICAAALGAAALLAVSRGADGTGSFRAGDVSVTAPGSGERRAGAAALRAEAERLMEAYTVPDDFCFRGVKG